MTGNKSNEPNTASQSASNAANNDAPSQTVVKLVSRRATLVNQWRKLSTDLQKHLQEESADQAEELLAQANHKWKLIKETTEKLEQEEGSENYINMEMFDEMDDNMVSYEVRVKRLTKQLATQPAAVAPPTQPAAIALSTPAVENPHPTRKLATLDLKQFRGDI